MSMRKSEDPAHIQLPKDVGERLGLQQGGMVIIPIEANRMLLEKRSSSPVDASFGLWAPLPPDPEYGDPA